MHIYQVGGCVRDALLGRVAADRDWLLVGATPGDVEQLLSQGWHRVGQHFPVLLHPTTHEEYALARHGGRNDAGGCLRIDPEVTLEQDLAARDLTINAMARDTNGVLVDPFGGHRDLEQGLLRHLPGAFEADAARIIRVARFAAQLGFEVAPETRTAMQHHVANGALSAIAPERAWRDIERGLATPGPGPRRLIETLRSCGALQVLMPELDALFGVPQPAQHHPEVDTGEHVLLTLDQACERSDSLVVRFSALVHDLGKGVTDPEHWPSHHGHEKAGVALVDALCERLKVPNELRDAARLVSEHHLQVHRVFEMKPKRILKLIEQMDGFRRTERFQALLIACECDARGRLGLSDRDYPSGPFLRTAQAEAADVRGRDYLERGYDSIRIPHLIRRERILRIAALKRLAQEQIAQSAPAPKSRLAC